jgi:hypothetical protein
MTDYVSSKVNAVMQIRGLCIEGEDVDRQIEELNMMEKILDTSAWTAEDLDLVGDARHVDAMEQDSRSRGEQDKGATAVTEGHKVQVPDLLDTLLSFQ